jgi:hypothetical protein
MAYGANLKKGPNAMAYVSHRYLVPAVCSKPRDSIPLVPFNSANSGIPQKTSSCSTCTPESMPKCRRDETICSRARLSSIQEQVRGRSALPTLNIANGTHEPLGRVCVPVEVSKVDEFEPTTVPTVGQLLRELDRPLVASGSPDDPTDAAKKAEPGEYRQ